MTAVELKGVSLRFATLWVLVRLDLSLDAGSCTLLTGGNGAGKTTLLRVLSTSVRPTRGRVTIFGRDSRDDVLSCRRQLGLMTHGSHLYEDLSGGENLSVLARMMGLVDHPSVGAVLERVGLAQSADRLVRYYSAGMKKRLIVGRMLLTRPKLVLLDEPFGQLDGAGIELMRDLIGELRQGGSTIVIATHLQNLGRSLCDVHFEMERGRIVFGPVGI